jgi:hypothetical protein
MLPGMRAFMLLTALCVPATPALAQGGGAEAADAPSAAAFVQTEPGTLMTRHGVDWPPAVGDLLPVEMPLER